MIRLDDNYRIEADAACWVLVCEAPTGKLSPTSGQPTFSREVSYHANFKQAALKYLDNNLKGSKTLQEVLTRISDAEGNILKAAKKAPSKERV